jgi:hypothetical protein
LHELTGRQEVLDLQSDTAKAEVGEGLEEPLDVVRGGLNPDVDILGGAGPGVKAESIAADDESSNLPLV